MSLGHVFVNLGEIPGTLQRLCGSGGVLSLLAGVEDPHCLCRLNTLSCFAACCHRGFVYLFSGAFVGGVKNDVEVSGLRGLLCAQTR